MRNLGLSDSVGGLRETAVVCPECGQSSTIEHGLCVNCLLRRGLAPETGDDITARFEHFLAEIDIPDREWRLGNYEILEEIARGGMGVVYRARQRHSRRIVGLKRILSFHADSHETLERFRREAEAAASLDHPNILPIYEVSESEGLPFFSMKYAAGGSLRDVGVDLRTDPKECAALLAKVSRATEYAHGQGILHRDLKPGNILLDSRGEPLVSDFGLAKWLDTSTDLTRTLTVFGTPGYIAPEQAEGATANLTPSADVYSLGAVLFDLLTGRPPFLGEHALAVIKQASEKPAPKLRTLAPTADRDLETICARCLEREPAARYQSAAALADDLEYWLHGKPIQARRVLPPTRVWRWSRRNPTLLATAAVCLMLGAGAIWFLRRPNVRTIVASLDPAKARPTSSGSAPEETAETNQLRAALVSYPQVELEQWHALHNAAEVPTRLEDGIYEQLSTQSRLPQTLLRTELPKFAKELTRQPAVDPVAAASASYLCKDFNEAERLALQAADAAQKLGDNVGAVRALTLASTAAAKHQEYARALERGQEADKLSDPERAPTDWLNLQIAVLQLYTERGEAKAAEQTKKMIEISSRVFGPESIQTARSRDWNGCMLLVQGRGDEAEAEHREAIRLKSKILGPEHPETINAMWEYGLTLNNENKIDLALAQYRRVYELRKKVLGPEHRDTLRIRNSIACELAYSDPEAAVKEWRDLIKTEEKVIGSDDMDTIRSTIYLGNILGCNLRRFAEAESLLRLGVAHADKLLKNSSRSPGDFWFVEGMRVMLAQVLHESGKFAEAEALERESLHACEQTVGPEGDYLPLIRKMLAAALDAQGKHRKAEEQLRQVARLLAKDTDPNHADIELGEMSVANMLIQGRAFEAEAEARRLIPVAEKKLGSRAYTRDANRSDYPANSCAAFGAESPLVCRMLLANALRDQKKYQEAEAEYRSVIEQQEKIIGPEDRYTLESYYNFAYQLGQQGRLTEAKTFTKQALDRAPKSYGPEHPVTHRYRALLGMVETGQPIIMAEAKFRDSLLATELPKQATR
jgi:serine/threonine protein kinase/flagellar biosynthesis regulator FlbT